MYLGFVAILLGITILMRSLSPNYVGVLFVLLMGFVFIRSEEKMLGEKFGDKWYENIGHNVYYFSWFSISKN